MLYFVFRSHSPALDPSPPIHACPPSKSIFNNSNTSSMASSSSASAASGASAAATAAPQDALLHAADLLFATQAAGQVAAGSRAALEDVIKKEMLVGWLAVCEQELGWMHDEQLANELESACKAKTTKLAEAVLIAKEKHGQVEVLEAELAVALHQAKTGSRDKISAVWAVPDLKTVSTGKRIDMYLEGARLGFAWNDFSQVRTGLDEAGKLLESGGDWDRRNRLKIYNGLRAMVSRDFKKASAEFLSGLATFTSDELFAYDRFCSYALVTSLVALDRVDLKSKVIDSPEVVAVLDGVKPDSPLAAAGRLIASLYECRYRDFMVELLIANDVLLADRYLNRHARWFLREMRVKAYAQFLTSYKSVRLAWMAEAFGVSMHFMDQQLSQFIALNRFAAKIDKVSGIVETNRPDTSNAKFNQVIKQGDALLNKVQKLARAIQV